MKVLMINPPGRHTISSEIPDVVREAGRLPPLGVLYLLGALKREGHETSFIDAAGEGLSAEETAARAAAWPADIVGVTTTTHQLVDAVQTLHAVALARPQALRLLGGPHVNVFPEPAAQLADVDAAFIDEADLSLPALLRDWRGELPSVAPAGVIFRRDGVLVRGEQTCKPLDLDELARPDRTLLNPQLYGDAAVGRGFLATVSTSRGCPFACTFCSTPGAPVRLRRPETVADEFEELVGQGYREAYLVDDTFNVDVDRATAICREIMRRRLPLRWTCRARLDRLTPELATALRAAGCIRVQLGVEGATPEALKALGKNITLEQARAAVRLLRRVGVPSAAYFMIGLPTDRTVADLRHTVDFAVSLDPDYAVFNVLTPYPHTPLYDLGVARGVIDPTVWPRFAATPDPSFRPPAWTEFLAADVLYRELQRAYRRFYLRPKVVWRQFKRLRPGNARILLRRARDVVRRPRTGR